LEYIYKNKRDSEIDEMAKPENLVKALPHYEYKMNAIALARKMTDQAAVSGPNGVRMAGYFRTGDGEKDPGLKIIARMPEALLYALLQHEPELVRDGSAWTKWLKKHPEFRAYSPGSKL
jgi:hypothetical protein